MRRISFILLGVHALFTVSLWAEESRFHPFRFGFFFTQYVQPDDSDSRSGIVAWSPSLTLSERFSFLADFGVTYLHTPDTKFVVLILDGRFNYRFVEKFSVDFIAGTQNWTNVSGYSPMAGLSVNFHVGESPFPSLDRIRVGAAHVVEEGYPTWHAFIGIEIDLERPSIVEPTKPPDEVVQKSPSPQETPQPLSLNLSSEQVSFLPGKSALSSTSDRLLQEMGTVLLKHNSSWSQLTITGHTDSSGKPEANQDLSLLRASSVAASFGKAGISFEKVHVQGKGSSEPLVSNDTSEGRTKNRRVEITITADPTKKAALVEDLNQLKERFSKGGTQ